MGNQKPVEDRANGPVQEPTSVRRVRELMDALAQGDVTGVVHELTVHQVELEMQNEELRTAEERLGRVRQKFVDHFMSAPISYVILEAGGAISEVNFSAQGMLGATRQRLIGRPFLHMVSSEDLALFRDCCTNAQTSGNVEICNVRLRTTGGTSLPVRMWIMAVSPRSPYASDSLRISFVDTDALMLDNSRMNQLGDHLNKFAGDLLTSEEELHALIHSLSHDMQICMRSIETSSRELQEIRKDRMGLAGTECALAIESDTRRLARLTSDLLEVIKVGYAPMSVAVVSLSSLATEAVASLQANHPNSAIKVTIAPDIQVKGDTRLLAIVIEKLLSRAWEAVAESPDAQIEFGVYNSGAHPVYFIRRNGAPVDPQQTDRLFHPYALLGSSAGLPSTGIGLALAARLVKRHHGKIWAAPDVNGETLCFTLWSEQ